MAQLVTHNTDELIKRIQKQTAKLAPSSPHLREAFTRIALYVTSVAKVNVRRHGLIDTGRLINSLRWEFFKEGKMEGVRVGSFNVPYAAVHEFGFKGMVTVPAHQRKISQAFGRSIEQRTINVRSFSRHMRVEETKYLRGSIETTRSFIVDTLRAALMFSKGKDT